MVTLFRCDHINMSLNSIILIGYYFLLSSFDINRLAIVLTVFNKVFAYKIL